MPLLLLLKLLLVPGLVALVTLAVRRWGPAVGGWLAGLPIVAGPVLVFYAVEQGEAFAARAAHATLSGLMATGAFAVAYGYCSRRFRWYFCVAVGWAVFGVAVLAFSFLQPGLLTSLVGLVAVAFGGGRTLPRPTARLRASRPVAGDLIARLIAAAALVLVLTSLADRLGPTWSGLLNAFPVLTTIVAAFSHAQRGTEAALAFLTGYLQAIVGFGLFCVVIALSLESIGLPLGLLLALVAQFAWHSALLARFSPSGVAPI